MKRAKVSLLDWFVLLPLFFLVATHTELTSDPLGSGTVFAIRAVAAVALTFLLLLRSRQSILTSNIATAILVAAYFLAINLSDLTPFAVMGTAFVFTGLLLSSLAMSDLQPKALFLIRAYLVVNIVSLVVGALVLSTSGQAIDFHRLMFPWSSARIGEFMNVARHSGIQIEPGTYANIVYLCVLISGLLRGRLFGPLEAIAILSTLLTLSAWAIIGVSVYFASVALQYLTQGNAAGLSARLGAATVAVLLLGTAAPLLMSEYSNNEYLAYFSDRFSGEVGKGSAEFKIEALDAWTSYLGVEMAIGRPLPDTYCAYCLSPQDLGTFLNLTFYFGILAAVPLLGGFSFGLAHGFGIAALAASTPLWVSKFFFYDPMIWIVLGFGLLRRRRNPHQSDLSKAPR